MLRSLFILRIVDARILAMKKKVWYLWLIVLLVKPIVDMILSNVIADAGIKNLSDDGLSGYIGFSLFIGLVICIIAIVSTVKRIATAFKNVKEAAEEQDIKKKHFWIMPVFAMATCILNTVKGTMWDVYLADIADAIDKAQNMESTLGHPGPGFVIITFLTGVIYFVISLAAGLILQLAYNSKKNRK